MNAKTIYRLLLALLLTLTASAIFAQEDNTLLPASAETEKDTLLLPMKEGRLMLIPFEPKMYRSEIDRYIGRKDGLNFQEIRGYFRLAMDNAIYLEAKKDYDVERMHADDPEVNRDLDYIYKSVGYQFREMPKPKEPEKKGISKFADKVSTKVKDKIDDMNGKEEPKPEGAYIQNGQLMQVNYTNERFMATQVINQEMFNYLSPKYGSGLYLFVNQLDIRLSPGQETTSFGSDNFRREIKVHFSILTNDKKEIYAGAVKREFSGNNNSIKLIILNNFPALAKEIVRYLPVVLHPEDMETGME
jgi:hypothetical protein